MTSRMIIPTDRSKIVQVDYNIWANAGSEPVCLNLTKRDVIAIYAQLEFLEWRTRWTNAPDDFNQISYAKDLQMRILTEMICWDCDQTIECLIGALDTNETLKNALINAIAGGGFPPDYPYLPLETGVPVPPSVRQNPIAIPDCSLDVLWGACISTIDNISALVLDFLESLDSADSDATRIAKVVDGIPVIGALADEITVTDVAEFAVLLVDEFKDGFLAGDTLPLRNEIACILFCICREKCEITFDDVFTAFTLVEDIDIDISTTVLALIAKFNLNLFTDRQIYVGLCLLGISAIATGNNFFGLFGGEVFNTAIIREGFDEPSNDWITLCVDCVDIWEVNLDLTAGEFGFEPVLYNGFTCAVYVPTVGFQSAYFQDFGILRGLRGAWIQFIAPLDTEFLEIEFTFSKVNGMTAIPAATSNIRNGVSGVTLAGQAWQTATSPLLYVGEITTTIINCLVRCGVRNTNVASDPNGQATITGARIRGRGYNPFA